MISLSVSAVPEGASSLEVWWVSPMAKVVALELSQLGSEAEELLHADGEVGAVEQPAAAPMARAFISGSCAYQPVVPTTMRPPSASTARMFSTAASGAVKSMTTSTPARSGAVSAEASWFSLMSRARTPWPRSRATSATSEPVFPLPSTRISIF